MTNQSFQTQAERIKALVAEEYGVTVAQMHGHRRYREVTWARWVAMWLCRELIPDTGLPMSVRSYARIGRLFRKDHTAVIHGVKRLHELMSVSPRTTASVFAMRERVMSALTDDKIIPMDDHAPLQARI